MKRIEDLNILILEDDRIFAEVLSRNLSRVGLDMSKISIFDTIEPDEDDFIHCKPDVVFLDLNIIGSSGLDTYYTAQPYFPNACFIILSGHNDEQLAMNCMEAGAQDYISKSDASAYALLKSIQYGLIRKKQLLKEGLYVKAFKNSPFPSVITRGKEGVILQVNDAFVQLVGKPVNEQEKLLSLLPINNVSNKIEISETVIINVKGEERAFLVWGGCIDDGEDLYLYKIMDKNFDTNS